MADEMNGKSDSPHGASGQQLPEGDARDAILHITRELIQQSTQLENLVGWRPWEQPLDMGATREQRLAATQALKVLVDKLFRVQKFNTPS